MKKICLFAGFITLGTLLCSRYHPDTILDDDLYEQIDKAGARASHVHLWQRQREHKPTIGILSGVTANKDSFTLWMTDFNGDNQFSWSERTKLKVQNPTDHSYWLKMWSAKDFSDTNTATLQSYLGKPALR